MPTLRESLKLDRPGVISLVGAGGKTTLMFMLAHELAQAGETVLTTTTTKIFSPEAHESPARIVSPSPREVLANAAGLLGRHRHLTAAAREIPDAGKLAGFTPEAIAEIQRGALFDWILVEADGSARRSLKMPGAHEPVIPAVTRSVVIVAGLDVLGKPLNDRWVFRSRLYGQVTGLALGTPLSEDSVVAAVLAERGLARGAPAGAERIVFLNKADRPEVFDAGRRIAALLVEPHPNRPARVLIGRAAHDPPVLECIESEKG